MPRIVSYVSSLKCFNIIVFYLKYRHIVIDTIMCISIYIEVSPIVFQVIVMLSLVVLNYNFVCDVYRRCRIEINEDETRYQEAKTAYKAVIT